MLRLGRLFLYKDYKQIIFNLHPHGTYNLVEESNKLIIDYGNLYGTTGS